jgi:DNA mismatch endonuclease (patch repair protein)
VKTLKQLAAMGWHTITVWECELKPARRQETLESLAFTLNRIFLKDHEVRYADVMELDNDISMAAEEWNER